MLHRRPDKHSHLDTIHYEIDMLRHCAKTLPAKRTRSSDSDEALGEYNLGIEGFLIHLRNLLGFFTTLHSKQPGDLRLDRPQVWYGKPLDEKEYSKLRDRAKALNARYSETFKNTKDPTDCYTLISKFLQHSTAERYEQAVVGWKIEEMFAAIEPVLADFKTRFPASTSGATKFVMGPADYSTTSFGRHSAILTSPPTKKKEE